MFVLDEIEYGEFEYAIRFLKFQVVFVLWQFKIFKQKAYNLFLQKSYRPTSPRFSLDKLGAL